MRTRWKILIAVLVFAVLSIVVTFTTLRVGPANSVEAYKNSLRARGEKLEISEVAPAAVPFDQNGHDAVQTAFNLMGSGPTLMPNTMWMIAPGKAMPGWAQTNVCGPDFTNSWEDFSNDVAVYAPAIESLNEAARFPKIDFGLDYQKGAGMILRHLAPFKRTAQVIESANTLALHEGDTATAATNLCVLLHLIAADEDERILISDLVRIAMTSFVVSGTWEFLQATNLTDAELATLQKSWSKLHFVQAAENAMLMERSIMPDWIEKSRASPAVFDSFYGGGSSGSGSGTPMDNFKMAVGKTFWRASWSYAEELNTLQCDQLAIQTLRIMETNTLWKTNYDTMMAALDKLDVSYPGQAIAEKLDIPDFKEFMGNNAISGFIFKTIRIEAARRIVTTAIALKRYQLQHGALPDNLSQLCPDFLPAVPLDPIDGNSLRYRKNDDGTYLLYSIGDDGVDNGGDPSSTASGKAPAIYYWQGAHVRDWVWPQPATTAEIQAYWATNSAAIK